MASFGCPAIRTDLSLGLIGLLGLLTGCATQSAARSYDAGVELPAGPGRAIVENQCLVCHELDALELFQDFYDRDLWRSLVISMRANGAEVDDAEIEIVSDYLAQHFGIE